MEREAFDALVRLLARRAHSRHELSQKLRVRGHTTEAIEAAFARAAELHLLEDEAAIAARYAEELAAKPKATPAWVEAKLRSRGLPEPSIGPAVRGAFDGWDPRSAAQAAVAGERDVGKAARRLSRRGFSSDVIAWVVRQMERAAGEEV